MIGIFAGSGSLPREIFSSLKKNNEKYIILNLSNQKFKGSINIQLGQFGKILGILKQYQINKVIFAGHVKRPNLKNLKLDFKAISYLPRLLKVFKKGDGNILNFATQILKKNKIKVIESHVYCKHLLVNKTITKEKPTPNDKKDFFKGKKILDSLSKFDNAQGIVLDTGYVVAIEAAEGTDQMLKRVSNLRIKMKSQSGVLIKLPKKKQSLSYDLPTIGYKTIQLCIKSKLNGIFLKKNQNIFLDQKKAINLANKHGIFITAY
tara:strand:- start:532 stop:1320 length:789 start_codon:yes stop_codon:yes gene_type:complete